MSSQSTGDSYIVSLYGLDGKRQHWMPGNRRRGTGPREKRSFPTEADASTFAAEHCRVGTTVYRCSICGDWHTASPKRR